MMTIGVFAVFLIFAAALTANLGLILKRHGDLISRGRNEIAGAGSAQPDRERRIRSANRLTLIGFCMVAAGAVALLLRIGGHPQSVMEGLAFLATRVGVLLVVLGFAHFHCLSVMTRASEAPSGTRRDIAGWDRPRSAREDPLDRVFEAARTDAPIEG